MEKKLGVVSIIVERPIAPVDAVNELLSEFGDEIIGRFGLPYVQRGVNIITLVVDTTVERIGILTDKLDEFRGVQVRSLMSNTAAPDADPAPGL